MVRRKLFSDLGSRLGRALYLLGRPARGDRGRGGTLIQPYRGFASQREIFLMGRVFRQQRASPIIRKGRLGRDLVDIARRISRRGAPGITLTARFGNSYQHVTTDRDGYFHIDMCFAKPPRRERLWHRLQIEAPANDSGPHRSMGIFFLPPRQARYVVISDIDDTVIFTGVANKVKMVWRLFFQGVRERVAFPGVAAFYRALHRGVAGDEFNPMLYVSRSPWGLYEILEEFFELHDIPEGPILFLREWGLSWRRPLPRRAKEYKLTLIRRMLAIYDELPFILIGDSGQRDPEIYAQIVREHPGRIAAIYIRDVSKASRRRSIEALSAEIAATGTPLLLATDTRAMAQHAAEHGFISRKAVFDVAGEKRDEEALERSPIVPSGLVRQAP